MNRCNLNTARIEGECKVITNFQALQEKRKTEKKIIYNDM